MLISQQPAMTGSATITEATGAQRESVRKSSGPQLVLAIILLLLGGVAMPILAQENVAGSENPFESLKQEAMVLKQDVLTASESDSEIVADTANKLLQKFDKRIDFLHQKLADSRDDMSETARRYADDLMSSMHEAREEASQRLAALRRSSGTAWDEALYKFSKAYESFYERWEDVEANLDPGLS